MRLVLVAGCLVSLTVPVLCQTPTAAEPEPKASQPVHIESFQSHKRADNYGIARFVILNGSDKPVTSIELLCWLGEDRGHGTKVLIWPSPDAIPPHGSQQFANVNIGLTGDARSTCEVAGVE